MHIAYGYESWSGKLSQWDKWLARQVATNSPFSWLKEDKIKILMNDYRFDAAFEKEVENIKLEKLRGGCND